MQSNQDLKSMTLEQRRQLEEDFYKTFLGICNKKNISPCHHEDIVFFAALLAKGDPECIVTCSKEKMLNNRNKMPHGARTIDFVASMMDYMKDKDPQKRSDKEAVTAMFRKGCDLVAGGQCAEKRELLTFFVIAVITTLVKVGGMVATGYISNMSKQQSTK